MSKPYALAIALFCVAGAAGAADLLQTYRDARGYDAQYASARAQLDAGRERIPQGRAGLLPSVALSGSTQWNDTDAKLDGASPAVQAGKRSFNSHGYQLQLAQPVFRMQNWITYDQAKLQVALSEAQFGQTSQDLILRVTQAYFDVLFAQDSLTVAVAQKEAIGQQLELAKKSFEVGTATITDTHEAQARYDLASAQEIAARSDLEVRVHALRQLVGREPEALRPLRQDVQIRQPEPADMQSWVKTAEESSYTVQAQQAGFEIASREVERARAGHYPTVDAVASYGNNVAGGSATSNVGTDITSTTIGLQLSVPLYQGGAVSSREREAAANRERARADLENAKRTAAQAARQFYVGVTSGVAQVKALEQALVSSQSALESNKLGYEVGVRINIDVLNAQQQLYSTRRDLAKARYDTLLAQLRLKSAVGTLAEADIEAINALLAP